MWLHTYLFAQELLACGIMNICGSLFSCFTAAGSLSRSTVQAVSGGKTQVCAACVCNVAL